jgi:hypothetical protein
LLLATAVDFSLKAVKSSAESGIGRWTLTEHQGEFGAQQAGIGAGEEEGDSEAMRGHLITVAVRDAVR